MEKNKAIFSGSIVAGAILGLTSLQANANPVAYSHLGTGAAVRNELLNGSRTSLGTFELKCAAKGDSSTAKMGKSKDGKCGEGKCGDKKMNTGKNGKTKDSKAAGKKKGGN